MRGRVALGVSAPLKVISVCAGAILWELRWSRRTSCQCVLQHRGQRLRLRLLIRHLQAHSALIQGVSQPYLGLL